MGNREHTAALLEDAQREKRTPPGFQVARRMLEVGPPGPGGHYQVQRTTGRSYPGRARASEVRELLAIAQQGSRFHSSEELLGDGRESYRDTLNWMKYRGHVKRVLVGNEVWYMLTPVGREASRRFLRPRSPAACPCVP